MVCRGWGGWCVEGGERWCVEGGERWRRGSASFVVSAQDSVQP